MTKPIRKQEAHNDLPPLNSDGEDDSSWGSEVGTNELNDSEDDESLADADSAISDNSDDEMPYETAAHTRRHLWNSPKSEVQRLPIKLPDGRIKATGTKVITTKAVVVQSEDEESTSGPESKPEPLKVDDVSTGARFGRVAVVDVLQTKSRKHRIEMAKVQIAGICQDILADPENSVGAVYTKSDSLFTPLHSLDYCEDYIPFLQELLPHRCILSQYRTTRLSASWLCSHSWPSFKTLFQDTVSGH
jgi:nucleolar complex protein 3